MVRKKHVHPADLLAGIKSLLYLCVFLRTAAGIPSSAPHVSSNNITCLRCTDQIMTSGRSRDMVISGGKMIGAFV